VSGRLWSSLLLSDKESGLFKATPSSKPLRLPQRGHALLVLQRLSIWLSLVVVEVEARLEVLITAVVEEPEGLGLLQGFRLQQARITP
jgi:hypothetical protein